MFSYSSNDIDALKHLQQRGVSIKLLSSQNVPASHYIAKILNCALEVRIEMEWTHTSKHISTHYKHAFTSTSIRLRTVILELRHLINSPTTLHFHSILIRLQVNVEDPLSFVMKWMMEENVKWSSTAYIGNFNS